MADAFIEYCVNNVDAPTRARLAACGLPVEESSCLQRCGHCFAGPFLVVDGALLDGAPHLALLAQVTPPHPPTDGRRLTADG
jgi:uncharacterized protein YuzB (UPF0349 family)